MLTFKPRVDGILVPTASLANGGGVDLPQQDDHVTDAIGRRGVRATQSVAPMRY